MDPSDFPSMNDECRRAYSWTPPSVNLAVCHGINGTDVLENWNILSTVGPRTAHRDKQKLLDECYCIYGCEDVPSMQRLVKNACSSAGFLGGFESKHTSHNGSIHHYVLRCHRGHPLRASRKIGEQSRRQSRRVEKDKSCPFTFTVWHDTVSGKFFFPSQQGGCMEHQHHPHIDSMYLPTGANQLDPEQLQELADQLSINLLPGSIIQLFMKRHNIRLTSSQLRRLRAFGKNKVLSGGTPAERLLQQLESDPNCRYIAYIANRSDGGLVTIRNVSRGNNFAPSALATMSLFEGHKFRIVLGGIMFCGKDWPHLITGPPNSFSFRYLDVLQYSYIKFTLSSFQEKFVVVALCDESHSSSKLPHRFSLNQNVKIDTKAIVEFAIVPAQISFITVLRKPKN